VFKIKECEICGRSSSEARVYFHSKSNKILCNKHKAQYDRYGKFTEQTRFEPNKIIIEGEASYICLNNREGEIIARAIIDTEDLDKIIEYKWFKRVDDRIVANITKNSDSNRSHVRLHNIIMNPELGYMIDHIEGNALDNRKSKMRIVTEKQNSKNNKIQSNNTSGVTGVVKSQSETWVPQIKFNRKMIRLGNEVSFDKAVLKRLKKEAELFKEFTRNYNPKTNTIQLSYLSKDDNIQTFVEVNLQGEIIKFDKSSQL